MPALVIGLGNPGGEYSRTRHNAGWRCLDELEQRGKFGRERREGPAKVREGSIEGFDVVVARPQTYMNLSGRAGTHLVRKFGVPVRDCIVVHDDLDLAVGRVQIKRGGGAGGQKGLQSLIDSWQAKDFVRVRIGIGRPPEDVDPADYVLRPFGRDEREPAAAAITRAADAVVSIIRVGAEESMTAFNRREPPAPAAGQPGSV